MSTEKPVAVQTRTIKWLYILALSMVAILTMTGQALVQWSLATLQGDSTTVNIAGRQRMLSQRIPRIILAIDADRHSLQADARPDRLDQLTQNQHFADDLNESLEVWRANHLGLANASSTVGLSRANSQAVSSLFSEIEPSFVRVQDIAQSVIDRISDPESEWISGDERTALLKHSDAFLSLMDAIVAQYELEAKQRVNRLKWIERGLLVATLLVLVCEGLFIFSPAIASLNRAFGRLRAVTDQLELAKESAEQANRAKTQFLASVSHELRTPLHAILGMLGLLRQGRLTHGQKQRANLAYDASQTLRHLVDDLLDVSSAESGSPLTLQLEKTNVAKVVRDCANLMQQQARRKRLKLYTTNELPNGTIFLLDAYRIRQIVINLLQNAIRYTATGEIECRTWLEKNHIHSQELQGKVWLHISVRDTGCGIAPENLECIFQNFVRINPQDGSNLLGPRLGLGLPITASLVTTMQGTITVESKLGEGSKFSIRIPTDCISAEMPIDTPQSNERDSSIRAFQDDVTKHGVTALVVDDSKANRILMREYLKRLRIDVCSTNSLTRALKLYKERLPQLILLDLQVGKQKSLGLLKSIRALPSGTTSLVFIVTADGHFSGEDCPAELDVAGVLHKPIEFEELRTEMMGVLKLLNRSASPAGTESQSNEFDDLRSELRRLLTENLPEEIERLDDAYARQDYTTFQLVAHRLRGSAANAGWTELAEDIAKLESQPRPLNEFKSKWQMLS